MFVFSLNNVEFLNPILKDRLEIIKVNGLAAGLSNDKSGPIYFSADGGTTAKTIANITAGDSLYWNGSIAGYELETSDDLDIAYQKSSND